MICNQVVTYYVPVENLWTEESQRTLIALWKKSWERHGWTATVLEEADVRSHPRFSFFNEHFRAKPTEYPADFTNACFMRWLAASHWARPRLGHVMLTDFDVINYGLEPIETEPAKMRIWADPPPPTIFMGVIDGGWQHFLDICELFVSWTPDAADWNKNAGLFHQDDLSMLERMFEHKTRPKPEWFTRIPGCVLFGFGDAWKTAKLVHYGYEVKKVGLWPKHHAIQQLRPV